jgi:hypothetical protein
LIDCWRLTAREQLSPSRRAESVFVLILVRDLITVP